MEKVNKLGNMANSNQRYSVYDLNDISPTLQAAMGTGGGQMPMIPEIKKIGFIDKGTGEHESNVVFDSDGLSPCVTANFGVKQPSTMHLEVKQASKDGYVPCKIGGVVDLSYPTSQTRRGRVIENGEICPTLTTENVPSVLEPWIWEIDGVRYLIRIRKLTPKECWRLMSFSDDDYNKAAEVNSNTQLYKQAGNSICSCVMEKLFRELL